MKLLNVFITQYGLTLLYTAITAVAGYLGLSVKKLYTKYINDKTKQDVVRTVVRAVEQIYKDLHGAEKLSKAVESANEMLAGRGVVVGEFNTAVK